MSKKNRHEWFFTNLRNALDTMFHNKQHNPINSRTCVSRKSLAKIKKDSLKYFEEKKKLGEELQKLTFKRFVKIL